MRRVVFLISDGTGITADSLGNSLMTQFENIAFEKFNVPYIDTMDKAKDVVEKMNKVYQDTGIKPLAFITLVNPTINDYITQSNACVFDLFSTFLAPMEKELQAKSSYTVGRAYGVADTELYNDRIEAVNYTLAHDDGIKTQDYDKADIILIGVSRCGKTPSCLYMALQFGILAANYPFTDEISDGFRLPNNLEPYKSKLFGLTIDADRLQHIRHERRPNSQYASTTQCVLELREVERMYQQEKIPYLNSTHYSIEEIATRVLASAGIKRKI